MMLSQSCDKRDVFSYEADRALFFERWEQVGTNKYVRLDTVQYSFSHYVGAEDLEHRFKVNLIGNLLEEDMEYRVIVVDSLTTATKDQYTIKDPVFRKGRFINRDITQDSGIERQTGTFDLAFGGK